MTRTKQSTPSERFWSKVQPQGSCWVWTAGMYRSGYGAFWDQNRMMLAHRWSYEAMVEQIPAGLQLDHLCRTRACVNPYHLDPVTPIVNVQRGAGANGGSWPETLRNQKLCKNGHPLSGVNLYTNPRTKKRACVTCNRANTRASRARRNAAELSQVGATIRYEKGTTAHFLVTVTDLDPVVIEEPLDLGDWEANG